MRKTGNIEEVEEAFESFMSNVYECCQKDSLTADKICSYFMDFFQMITLMIQLSHFNK